MRVLPIVARVCLPVSGPRPSRTKPQEPADWRGPRVSDRMKTRASFERE